MRATLILAAGLLALTVGIGWADAPPQRDEDVLRQMIEDGGLAEAWIAPAARSQLTPELVENVLARVRAAAGDLVSVTPAGDRWLVVFERANTIVLLSRDENDQINGLWFNELVPNDLTPEQAALSITALPGETALLVTQGNATIVEFNSDSALLVGSVFKLAVLAALRDAVAAGEVAWDQVVRLDRLERSLPSGALQDFPDGHPVTIATLAMLMIAISDNTATDRLIDLLGRERIETIAGLAPLMTTAEYFKLKADGALYDRYQDADLAERREILAALGDSGLPGTAAIANGRTGHGWAIPATAMCALIADVSEMDAVGVNPGAVHAGDWSRVAFKGGSDVGVIAMAYWLQPTEGAPYCVAAVWNDDGVDEAEFARLVAALVTTLRETPAE